MGVRITIKQGSIMKSFVFISFIFLIGCQSTQNEDVARFESKCPTMSASEKGSLNATSSPVFRTNPKYPISAARERIEGYVKFEFDISKDGNPINIQVIESYPADTFVYVAKNSLSDWKFSPVIKNKEAILSKCHSVQLDFVFA
jgi:TonB family protein